MFFQAEDGIRFYRVTGVQTCALPIWPLDGVGPRSAQRVDRRPAERVAPQWQWPAKQRVSYRIDSRIGRRYGHRNRVREIGRASCRERMERGAYGVCKEGEAAGDARGW